MIDTPATATSHWTTRFGAEAAVMAGVVWLVLWRHQALTHGTTQENERLMALGFTWMDSGKLFVLPFLLLIVTMVGLQRSRSSPGRLGKSGFVVVAALIWLVVGTVAHFWGFPLGSYELSFEDEVRPLFKDGWRVQMLGTLFLTLAFVPFGINLVRERSFPPGWCRCWSSAPPPPCSFLPPSFFRESSGYCSG